MLIVIPCELFSSCGTCTVQVRLKIADDNDLNTAKDALVTMSGFFVSISEEAARRGGSATAFEVLQVGEAYWKGIRAVPTIKGRGKSGRVIPIRPGELGCMRSAYRSDEPVMGNNFGHHGDLTEGYISLSSTRANLHRSHASLTPQSFNFTS